MRVDGRPSKGTITAEPSTMDQAVMLRGPYLITSGLLITT